MCDHCPPSNKSAKSDSYGVGTFCPAGTSIFTGGLGLISTASCANEKPDTRTKRKSTAKELFHLKPPLFN